MSHSPRLVSVLILLALASCDRQVDRDYQGDLMLRIQGSLTSASPVPTNLHPSAMFGAVRDVEGWPIEFEHINVMPLAATGDFPARFTVDLLEPPPSDSIVEVLPGEVPYATGDLTVVGPDFPAIAFFARPRPCEDETVERCTLRTVCRGVPPDGGSWAYLEDGDYTRLRADAPCFQQRLSCPTDVSSYSDVDCAVVSEEGDPLLRMLGFSRNLQIVYFSEPVPQDSVLAAMYNQGNAISAGYHAYILDLTLLPAAPPDPNLPPSCEELLRSELMDRYDVEHGTSHIDGAWSLDFDPNSRKSMAAFFAFERSAYALMRERGCPIAQGDMVEVGKDQWIEILLQTEPPQR